jgi:flagellar basal body-associated protein FliL
MADKDVIKPKEVPPPQPAPPVTIQPAPPEVPSMVPDLGGVGTTKPAGEITIKIWILIIVVVFIITPYFFIYLYGYQKGCGSIFQSSVNSVHLKSKYANPAYPILDLEVNLSDKNPKQFVKLSLSMILREDTELVECSAKEPVLRDLLIMLLSRYSSDELASPSELNKLKRLIKDEMNAILSESRVTEIYFTKFYLGILQPEKIIKLDK